MAAVVHDTIYYETLTELDNDAKMLIENNFHPDMANDSLIVKIFSNNVPMEELKPTMGKRPVIIITAGSPGVGKSTVAKEQFRKYGVDPNKVYTISMDTLLERNKPFRNETKKLYNKWHEIKGEFINSNYATFSGISTAAYAAKQANFKIPEKIANVNRKFSEKYGPTTNEDLAAIIQELVISSPKTSPKKSRATRKKVKSPPPSPPKTPPKAPSPPKNTTLRRSSRLASKKVTGGAITRHLDDIREVGFEFGVANGLNILYDCTLTSTGKRMNAIMEILEKYAEIDPKYQIKVLLIKADDNMNKAAEIIQARIQSRHQEMIRSGFLRALTPNIYAIKTMIKTNKDGFDMAVENYGEKIMNPPYDPTDFYFEEIVNAPH